MSITKEGNAQKKEVIKMFKYYIPKTGTYSETAYSNRITACNQAQLVSAIHRTTVWVVDIWTGEILDEYDMGLLMED